MITLVGSTAAGGFQTSVTVNLPAGVADGDRLLLLASANDHNTITSLPSGWAVLTEDVVGTGVSTWVFTRVADGEPADYNVTWSGDHWHFLNLLAFRGVDSIRTFAVASASAAATVDLPSLPAEDGDALVAAAFCDQETTKSWPGALTTITNLPRGLISAWQTPGAGDTTAHTLTCGTAGHVAATAILLTAIAPAPAEVDFPLQVRAELQLGGEWVDISARVRQTSDVAITRGRPDEASTADASVCTLTLDNTDGRFSPRNPNSPYFGQLARNTPLRVGLVVGADFVPRYAGEVSEWPPRWDLSENNRWVDIRAAGLLRRFAQGAGHARSALRRFIRAASPLAYWPLIDGGAATVALPDVGPHEMIVHDLIPTTAGGVSLKRDVLDWADGSLTSWMEPVARTRTARGSVSGRIDRTELTAWSVDMVRSQSGGEDRLSVRSHLDGLDMGIEWRVRIDYAVPELRLFVRSFEGSPGGTFTDLGAIGDATFFLDEVRHLRLSVTANGSSSDWVLYIDGVARGSGTAGFAVQPPELVTYSWNHQASASLPEGAEHAHIGHFTVWPGADEVAVPTAQDVLRALEGHAGERAGVRIQRLAAEEGIALQVIGDLEGTPPMGPQYVDSPLSVMREAEAADRGMLFEARDEVALVYRTHRSRYNQHLNGRP
jgi:hypothetical protein